MIETEIYILGYPVMIRYIVHDPSYVEWHLVCNHSARDVHDLLNVLLRVHFSEFIEAACREHHFYKLYAESQGAPETEDCPF